MRYLVHHLLESSARRSPDAVAVVDGERRASYRELDAAADRVAAALEQTGVRAGDRVALLVDKSLEAVAGLDGVLKVGAAYVPLDVKAPTSRLAYIVSDCAVRVLLSDNKQRDQWPALAEAGVTAVLARDGLFADGAPELIPLGAVHQVEAPAPGAREVIDQDLAYILYTSGSTGQPKGVKLSHRNALAFVEWAVEEFSVTDRDRLSSHAPFHFDLSVFDLFAAAMAGASVHLVPVGRSMFPVEVARFIRREQITVWYSVPSILSMLTQRGKVEDGGGLPSLRLVLFAGEVFPTKYLSRLMHQLPHAEFANLYGPTETNVCTFYRVPDPPPEDAPPVPIGRAIANVATYVVGDDDRVVAPGEVGELYVRGATVMLGYWGDAEKTGRVRLPGWAGDDLPDPVYRTGDLVRQLPDGNYEFLGRRDNQVKSRGYRIELGEIEAALYAHPSVVEAVAVAVPDEEVTNRICAVVSVRDDLSERELQRFVAERVPSYMVPEEIEIRRELPKTSTGKVDRQRLLQEVAS